ncbi:hypothetical protein GCM10027056_30800 [Glaciibacter psychrotolerans]
MVAGGLLAAITAPLSLDHGSWAAAYLVLVVGVAQIALGRAQAALVPRAPSRATVAVQVVAWNGGSAAVLAGTFLGLPLVVDTGGVLLVVTLVLAIRALGPRAHRSQRTAVVWARASYLVFLALVLVSIPIGLTLAHLRSR